MKRTMTPSDDAAWTALGAGKYDITSAAVSRPGPWKAPRSSRARLDVLLRPALTDLFNEAAASGRD
jgi:hypothetical protein